MSFGLLLLSHLGVKGGLSKYATTRTKIAMPPDPKIWGYHNYAIPPVPSYS